MRGDIAYRVYGVHEGRADDYDLGAFRTRAEAEAEVTKLSAREMDGRNWAAQYHNKGFVIREHVVETDFELPSLPKPRDRYVVKTTSVSTRPGAWNKTRVEVLRRSGDELERICEYERNYAMLQTFEPFRQGNREFALISQSYTRTAVLDLATGEIIAEESEASPGGGFCPVGFYVPDWWDLHNGSIIPGSQHWDADDEWPVGDFGFVWGCIWGDDSSWKVQHLDLRRVRDGVITRDERFGYVELATGRFVSPCLELQSPSRNSRPPPFIELERFEGSTRVQFAVELKFDLDSGRMDKEQAALFTRGREADEGN